MGSGVGVRLHRPVERALESSGLSWTFLRPNFFMQNFSRQMAAAVRDHGVFAQPATSASISFVVSSRPWNFEATMATLAAFIAS